MSVSNPVKVPEQEITSNDVADFSAGLFQNGIQNAPSNSITASKDVQLTIDGYVQPRDNLEPFLPDTIESGYQKLPVNWQGTLYFFTLDHGQAVFCRETDTGWTACGSPGTAATYITALTGSNNDLVFTAVALNSAGDSITIAYVTPGTPSAALSVSVSGNAITVHLATDGSSAVSSTGNTVMAAIIASTSAAALVHVALASGNTGAGIVTAMSAQNLAGGVDSTNIFVTQNGGQPILMRILDTILILNGGNGDKLARIELATTGFPVVKYDAVADPTSALTASSTTLTITGTQPFNIYYSYTYTTSVGETLLAPILTVPINITRDQWQTQSTPASLTLNFSDTPPAGAEFRNIYVALAPTSGSIQDSDMLTIATKQPTTQTIFIDDGSLDINLGAIAPIANSTDGPKVQYGISENGNPILYGDPENPSNIYIGGGGPYSLSFSISNNGYTAQGEQGTNYVPTIVVGFRSGTGVPGITVLYSNTEGLSRQAILQQQSITYGDTSFSVWGLTEQHYGSAGVAAPNSAINYNGKLALLTTDGFVTYDTAAQRFNVISAVNISDLPIGDFVKTIKPSAMGKVVGTGWNSKYLFTVPSNGFDTAQQILVYDTSNNKTAFYVLNIKAQWLGVVTAPNEAAFVYACVGKSTYKLLGNQGTFDVIGGINKAFSTNAYGAMIGMGSSKAHNEWQADVQAMFNILDLVGTITVGVNYRNENGDIKTKTKVFSGPAFTPSRAGGWGDPGWGYAYVPGVAWSGTPVVNTSAAVIASQDVRIPVQIDDIFNEAQGFVSTDIGFNDYKWKSVSYEGINLGVRPDLQ